MTKNKTTIFLIIFIIILVALAIFLWFKKPSVEEEINEDTTPAITKDESAESPSIDTSVGINTINDPEIPAPSLTSIVNYDSDFPEDAKVIMEEKIATTRATLTTNPKLYESWIELGNQYKIVGDYSKAVESWIYAGALSPYNSISFHNLGDVYGYYLGEPQKAEENFLKSINNSPFDSFYYIETYLFYKDVLKDSQKAKFILEKGLEEVSDSTAIQKILDTL